jgi:LmbE family N-acetylglucosaminyl deacetylase
MATVLAFHAHPDDEVLLTGGALAKAAADGHRVVIVVATDGALGHGTQGDSRLRELEAAAAILGVARVIYLGYADSGHGPILYPDPPDRVRFARADSDEAAQRLAGFLREEAADVLISYDAYGGYGHRDHVKVHEVGKRAADLTGVRVLEATLPRERVARALILARLLRLRVFDESVLSRLFTPRASITHQVNVRPYARQKRNALAAHRSQVLSDGSLAPLLRIAVRLPAPVFGWFAGTEWFADASPNRASKVHDDILA